MIKRLCLISALSCSAIIPSHAQLGPAPIGSQTVLPQAATRARTLGAKLGDTLSLIDFGAACDGTTDDSAAIAAAAASGARITIPGGKTCFGKQIATAGLGGIFIGPGQIKTSDGNLRGPKVIQISRAPSTSANGSGGVLDAFNADQSQVLDAIELRITGSALGQPSSGYLLTPEVAAENLVTYNSSGYDNPGTGGRTGLPLHFTSVGQYGQGDAAAYWTNGLVNSACPAGSTTFLSCAEAGALAGQFTGFSTGAYLEGIGDLDLSDDGTHAIAAIGTVFNLSRNVAAGPLGQTWMGHRVQSRGTQPIDAAYSATGAMAMFMDPVDANTAVAMAMGAGQRIYGGATQPNTSGFPGTVNLGTSYIDWNAANYWELVAAGVSALHITASSVQVAVPLTVAAHVSTTGTAPTVTSCGTSTVEYGSTDNAGAIDFAGSPKSCTLVFSTTFAAQPAGHPFCVLTAKGSTLTFIEEGDTATSLIFASTAFGALTNSVNYHCN